jgi:hypothetical protein
MKSKRENRIARKKRFYQDLKDELAKRPDDKILKKQIKRFESDPEVKETHE